MEAVNPRRRRGLGVVTPNACTECRKKRAKCDGQVPCGRCKNQESECVYEIPIRQSKEAMRTEIERLRSLQQKSDRIFLALGSMDTSEQVLQQLRDGVPVQDILENTSGPSTSSGGENTISFPQLSTQHETGHELPQGEEALRSALSSIEFDEFRRGSQGSGTGWPAWDHGFIEESNTTFTDPSIKDEDAMAWDSDISPVAQHQPPPLTDHWSQTSKVSTPDSAVRHSRGEGQATILGEEFSSQQPSNHNRRWTTVTDDEKLVEHLMSLYFCWEYPTFASLSKEHFLEDFRNGTPRYCSSMLVNAILAVGCRFSDQVKARANPHNGDSAGDRFVTESLKLLEQDGDHHKLTTIQTMGLLSIREASCGRTSQSLYFTGQSIRLAVEMGLHQVVQIGEGQEAVDDHAVRSATFWGAFSLDQAWSLSLGRIPHFSRDLNLVTKPALIGRVEASSWVPYSDHGMPQEKAFAQPSNVRSVFKTFCELSELVHSSLYTLYAPGARVTSRTLMQSYTRYISWYEAIPATLRLGHNFTPAVLFAHMYYHYAILLLFRPFIKLDIIGSAVSPRDMCIQAADAISALVSSYSKLYTLRRTPAFVPYFVLTSGIAHLVGYDNSPSSPPDKIRQSISDLREMTRCHGFADRALEVLHFLVRHWEIHHVLDDGDGDGDEDYVTTICRPSSTSLNLFCPNISHFDMVTGTGPVEQGQNPLFWPFPLQGKPLLEIGDRLESVGFKIIS